MVSTQSRRSVHLAHAAELLALALISYVPFLLSSPGRISSDSKQALYVDPERFLASASSMWDGGFGGGTVPHQHIGYLWPMGPWFWFFEQIGVPDWIAQRLWLGTLTFAAALGMRWLLTSLGASRSTALAGALVYALTPYQLAFLARTSVILLPWVGLPVLVELTRRALRHGGWRHPALFALVVATVAGVNATSLALVALGPFLVVLLWAVRSRRTALTAVQTSARIGVLVLGASAWWLAGLRLQGGYGLPVLQLTENLTDIARWSLPGEVLRGLGNWFFAGRDSLGYSVDQADAYLNDSWVIALTLVVPMLALAAAVVVPGRVRVFAVACIAAAVVVSVGAWPMDQPSVYGRWFRWFAEETSIGLALRNSHRIVPVLLLGFSVVLAAAIERLPRPTHRRTAAGVLGFVAIAAMLPAVVPGGLLSRNLDRPEELPDAWLEVAEDLDERGRDATGNRFRVLDLPGTPFAAHRWGNTVEPILPSLLDRPYLAREVLPYGSIPTINLLDALDRRMQEGVFEPASLAPVARLFAASDLVVRSDLQFERYRTPEPFSLWSALTTWLTTDPTGGLTAAGDFGPAESPTPDRSLAPIAERDLFFAALAGGSDPLVGAPVPAASIIQVDDAPGILQVLPSTGTVVLAGDGDGVVDAAAAGLVDGRSLVTYAGSHDSQSMERALDAGGHLILTDTNRRRIQTWFYAIRDTRGPTERSGETLVEPSGYDERLDLFPDLGDEARTVVEHRGAQVSATGTGGAARPEDRAMAAFDGDLATAWRVGGADPRGHRLSVVLDEPIDLSEIWLTQPQDGPRDRILDRVRVHLEGAAPIDVALDDSSLEPGGQRVPVPAGEVHSLEIEIVGVTHPGFDPALANAVGLAEVGVGSVEITETVMLPPQMLAMAGSSWLDASLDIVLSRLRYDPADRGRTDTERRLDRTVTLPGDRAFGLTGTARLNPRAPDAVLQGFLAPNATVTAQASSRLVGDLTAWAGSAIDGDHGTAWTAAFGEQVGQWLEVASAEPAEIDEVVLWVVDDELHSTPSSVRVEVDGLEAGTHDIESNPGSPGTVREITIPLSETAGQRVRVIVDSVHRRSAPAGDGALMATLPVAVSELELDGPNVATAPVVSIDTGCRGDLVTLGGEPLGVRVTGPAADARAGLEVVLCDDDLTLEAGQNRIVSTPGHESGVDFDRLVLSSQAGGGSDTIGVRGGASTDLGTTIVEVDMARQTEWSSTLETDGAPFWLVFGQSYNPGWEATVDAGTVVGPVVVNGYANGWFIEPSGAGTIDLSLSWVPQRVVWWAFAISAFALGLCVGVILGTRRAIVSADRDAAPLSVDLAWSPGQLRPSPMATAVAASLCGLGVALVSRPWIGIVAALIVVARAWFPPAQWALALAAPAALAMSFVVDRPNLAWVAVGIVVAATVGAECASRWSGVRGRTGEPRR